ncbi:patched domain-containing protein 3-like [Clytia hemisphaerica]|uniref:SSD domain-containing protein n=1 Tax=Clytia hemisphaerica TaxID=252671 RepID=A0A7M5VCP4_9CNID
MTNCCSSLWRGWVRICSAINGFFERSFVKWSGIVFDHPWKVILSGLLIALGLMAGFARFNPQTQTERLFFPEHSRSRDDLERAEKTFPSKFKPDQFFITMADGVSSVLNSKALKLGLKYHNRIMNETGIEQICLESNKSLTGVPCVFLDPLFVFSYNESSITDASIQPILTNALRNRKIIFPNGITAERNFPSIFGRYEYDNITQRISATALRFMYFNKFPETDSTHKLTSDIQKKMIDILLDAGVPEAERNGMKLYLLTGRSTDDGISESSGGDISLVAVSITLMCTFATVVLFRLRNRVNGHVTVGFAGIGCIALGIGSGFGMVMLSGQYFVAFVGTLPFLVLGVGIDDMFIILDALDSLPSDFTGKNRLQKTMAKVGASVTMTTVTDVIAFAISSSTDFPAIRYFCVYALTSILFAYLLIMTVFLAALALDIKRIEVGNWDWFCCKKQKDNNPWSEEDMNTLSKTVMKKWAEFLMKTPVRIVVVFLSLVLLAAGIYGTTQLAEKFDIRQLAPDGSYFIDYLDNERMHYPVGFQVSIINDDENFDYTNPRLQGEYNYLSNICKENSYMKKTTVNWLQAFLESNEYKSNPNMTFYQRLGLFLKEFPEYGRDIKWHTENEQRIRASKIQCQDLDTDSWDFRKKAMLSLRDEFDSKSNISNSTFPISFNYFYREQMVSVPSETMMNLVLCAIAILIITTPYLVHPLVILMVFGGFVALVFELFGLMVIWDVALNSISMITSIMAIGFAVDYSAHVAHAYLLVEGDTPEQRMINAISSIGASVFMGGFTTFLGILVLIFGQSEIFRIFFKMVFGIVVLGLLNGLLFLPVYLSLFVRNKVDIRHTSNYNQDERLPPSGGEKRPSKKMKEMNNKVGDDVIENPHSPEFKPVNGSIKSNDLV